jgi:hypothetical protein
MFGISFALFFSSALNIVTGIENATQYIKQIILTENWTVSWTTWVFLDWALHRVWADYLCNRVAVWTSTGSCASISNLVSLVNNPSAWWWDNLWNHTATGNIRLWTHYLSYWSTDAWLQVMSDGDVYVSNNLWVSTSNPSQKLHVNWNAYISWWWLKVKWWEPQLHLQPTSTTSTLFLEWNPSSYIKFWWIAWAWSDNFYIGNDTSNSLVFWRLNWTSSYKTVMTIKTWWNIGIWTDSPSTELDINGTIRIRWWVPREGRILISDDDGLASRKSSLSIEVEQSVSSQCIYNLQPWVTQEVIVLCATGYAPLSTMEDTVNIDVDEVQVYFNSPFDWTYDWFKFKIWNRTSRQEDGCFNILCGKFKYVAQ